MKTLNLAVDYFSESKILSCCKVSSYYETEPYGVKDQAWFLNIAMLAETTHSPQELLFLCKALEYLLGRKPRARWHEREIDIDLLLYNDYVTETEKLIVPHSMMHKRNFVMAPVAEIAPNMIHPKLLETMSDLYIRCEDTSQIRKIEIDGSPYTK